MTLLHASSISLWLEKVRHMDVAIEMQSHTFLFRWIMAHSSRGDSNLSFLDAKSYFHESHTVHWERNIVESQNLKLLAERTKARQNIWNFPLDQLKNVSYIDAWVTVQMNKSKWLTSTRFQAMCITYATCHVATVWMLALDLPFMIFILKNWNRAQEWAHKLNGVLRTWIGKTTKYTGTVLKCRLFPYYKQSGVSKENCLHALKTFTIFVFPVHFFLFCGSELCAQLQINKVCARMVMFW